MWEFSRSEPAIRLGCFVAVFAAMAVWELLAPRRALVAGKPLRWASNLGLVFINSLLLRLVAPLGAVGVALLAESLGWGLFQNVAAPRWLAVVGSVVLLDLAIYLQHVMFHAVPLFWRLHMVHHADLDIDVTTGLRFHTVEILLSLGIKAAVVILLGPPAAAVLIFEVLLNATSMFNHSNVRMPGWLDRLVRCFVVTPDMHRVHHSIHSHETNSNFGFNHPWWDFLLGTYRAQPEDGHAKMAIGLTQFRDEHRVDRLPGMLLLPVTGWSGDYAINRRGAKKRSSRGAADAGYADATRTVGGDSADGAGSSVNPMDERAEDYDRWFDSPEGQTLFAIELDCVRELLGGHTGRWLEVGVGTGRFAAALGIHEGVDPSEPALLLARSRRIDARQGVAEHLPYSAADLDGILLLFTLCFLGDPQAAMQEFRRVLKPGGLLVVGIVPAGSPWGLLYAEKGRQGHAFYSRARFFTPDEAISLAAAAGFELERACSCLLSPPQAPPSTEVRAGIVETAGFVSLRFVHH